MQSFSQKLKGVGTGWHVNVTLLTRPRPDSIYTGATVLCAGISDLNVGRYAILPLASALWAAHTRKHKALCAACIFEIARFCGNT